VVLGIAAIIGVRAAAETDPATGVDRIAPVAQLQEGAAMIGLVLLAAFFRPQGPEVGWQLPAIAWMFVTLGMGTALGAVIYAVLETFKTTAEVTLLMAAAEPVPAAEPAPAPERAGPVAGLASDD
jgi:hypothetical protein